MIMFFLPWWTYVLVGTIAFTCALAGQWLANLAELGVRQDDAPYPCHAYLGQTEDRVNLWCWLMAGHTEDHADQFGLEETVFTREWPEEDGVFQQTNAAGDVVIDENPGYLPGSAPRPSLPQRLSKVPVQPEHNDPWPVCGHSIMTGTCDLAKGHPGDHSHMCY